LAHDVPNKLNTDKVLVVVSFGPLRRKGPSLEVHNQRKSYSTSTTIRL
jgi:hypothetical protein